VAPFVLDRLPGLFGILLFLFEINDGDICAFAGIKDGNRAPDTGVATGNESNFVLQLFRAFV